MREVKNNTFELRSDTEAKQTRFRMSDVRIYKIVSYNKYKNNNISARANSVGTLPEA